jgi:hypothetical protein
MKVQLHDPSPGTGSYEGDLRYGRSNHGVPVHNMDFAANRNSQGQPTNPPIAGIPPAFIRDPLVWRAKCSIKAKKITNPPEFQDELVSKMLKYKRFGLGKNVSHIKLGRSFLF